MKKRILSMAASFVLISTFFVSCGEEKNKKPAENQVEVQSEEKIEEKSDEKNEETVAQEKTEEKVEEKKEVKEEKPFQRQSIINLNFSDYEIKPFDDSSEKMSFMMTAMRKDAVPYPPTVYFLGWSMDGKIAYKTITFVDGIGENRECNIVQDTVTDKILYSSTRLEFEDGADYNTWNSEFENEINKYKIYVLKANYCAPSEENADGPNGKSVWFKIEGIHNGYDEDGFSNIDYECYAKTKNSSKLLTSAKKQSINDVYVCGYVKSPFENRVALFLGKTSRGFEQLDLNYEVVGCNMDVGL